MKTAAILYQREGYDTHHKRLMGRQAAGEGFLKAIARYGTTESLYGCTENQAEFEEFCQQIRPWLRSARSLRWVPFANPQSLRDPGLLYRPDPQIAQLAWQRRYADQRAYSLCGITHTLASKEAMAAIGDLLIAPIQPWDALICTSLAVKTMVDRLLETWAEYLAQRMGARPEISIKLPVIPLGVDCDAFSQNQTNRNDRQRLRQQLGIGADDLVILYVGRLIFHAKAHPIPMYLAVERAVKATNAKVHLLQAGWFEDPQQELEFKKSAALFSPSVHSIFVDGRQAEMRQGIWAVADIFISLADSIQETFGLTPIEAMAAGLPIVVSDWNGYQETVRHEVDGFRIWTTTPPAGCGLDLAANYHHNSLGYNNYLGHLGMMTAIDIEACAQALMQLLTEPDLRRRLGENGRQRAIATYDWRVVIAAYEDLWQELSELREQEPAIAPLKPETPPYPLCDDPFRLLAHYPTQALGQERSLTLGLMAAEGLERLRSDRMTQFGSNRRSSPLVIQQVIAAVTEEDSLTVAEILRRYSSSELESQCLHRTLVYLIKFDILRWS
jgi:alpha-maltose-1-phosphate synthase